MPGSNHSFKCTLQGEICLELSLVWRVLCGRRVLNIFLKAILSECVCVHACPCKYSFIHMEIRQQWTLVRLSLGSWRSNSDPSDWAASAFPLRAISASRCCAFHMTLLMKSHHNSSSLALLENDTIFLRRMFKRLTSSAGSRLNCSSSDTSDSGRMNLESVLCSCLKKKDCLDLEEWRVLERAQRNNPCVRLKAGQQLTQATFPFSRSSLQARANLNKKLAGHVEKMSP